MEQNQLIHGISATTHVDKTGERLSKENLEEFAQQVSQNPQSQYMYWDHETTLPPIGIYDKLWVEKCDKDDEYQLMYEGLIFGDEYSSTLREYEALFNNKREELHQDLAINQLQIATSYQSFSKDNVDILLKEIKAIAPAEYIPHTRKSAEPSPVIWIFLVFVLSNVAAGFFTHVGENLADSGAKSLHALGKSVAKFIRNRKDNKKSDIIFGLPIPNANIIVEAAVEYADTKNVQVATTKLPFVYREAMQLVAANHKDYFEQIKYLFNPETGNWEVNYLVVRKSKEIILGPRYYEAEHPLHARYKEFQEQVMNADLSELGMSIGGTLKK